MTEEEKRNLYEKGYYNSDLDTVDPIPVVQPVVPAAQPNPATTQFVPAGPEKGHYDSDNDIIDTDPIPTAQVTGTTTVTPTTAPASATPGATTNTPDGEFDYADAVNKANNAAYTDFYNYVNDIAARNRAEEEEMARQEQANRRAAFATGATELAANVANLLSVGQLHASNQQYHSYSQDWMRKADQDIREHRRRRDGMRGTLDRLRLQQNQIRDANLRESLALQFKMQQERAAEAQREADRQKAEEAAEAKRVADMQTKGFVPDPNSETGFRFDPDLAREMAFAKSTKTARPSSTTASRKPSSANPTVTQPRPVADDSSAFAAKRPSAPANTTQPTATSPNQARSGAGSNQPKTGEVRSGDGSGEGRIIPSHHMGTPGIVPKPRENANEKKKVKDYSEYKVTV